MKEFMKNELEEIHTEVVKHCNTAMRYDEHLFDLGVRLGRLLEKNSITDYRLKAFVDNEEKNNLIKAKIKQANRIHNCLKFLIQNAVAQHIDKNDHFVFDENESTKLDDEIVQKFFVQSSNTKHSDESSFQVEFVISGEVADIFEKYDIEKVVSATISNTTGDTQETLYNADDVKEIFSISLPINFHHTNLTEQQIADMADELEKIIVVLTLSLKNIR